jgi:hypothetical protein
MTYRLLEKEYHLKLHSAVKTISVYLSGPPDIKIFNIPEIGRFFLQIELPILTTEQYSSPQLLLLGLIRMNSQFS